MWTSAAQWGEFGDSPCFVAGEATRKVQGRNVAGTVSWSAYREGFYQRLKVSRALQVQVNRTPQLVQVQDNTHHISSLLEVQVHENKHHISLRHKTRTLSSSRKQTPKHHIIQSLAGWHYKSITLQACLLVSAVKLFGHVQVARPFTFNLPVTAVKLRNKT
jgi:hypothetical protein